MMPIRHRADRGHGSRTVLRLSDDRTVVPSTQGMPSSAPSTAPPADPDCPSWDQARSAAHVLARPAIDRGTAAPPGGRPSSWDRGSAR